MTRVLLDSTLTRSEAEGFQFPLGVYPSEPLAPVQGYTVAFEPADGSESPEEAAPGSEWEEWPDRFVYDIAITHARVRALCRALLALLPGRVYPILDILGHDAYREVDPYIAYDLVGIERFADALREYEGWFFEDGFVGFGVMSVDPFLYIFVDEHKVVTVRAPLDLKERVEKVLAAFDLGPVEEIRGADGVAHEHRSVLVAPDDQPEYLNAEEILEHLRDSWRLELNVDASTNVDAEGNDLGVTAWQCVARCTPPEEEEGDERAYAEVLLSADSLQRAETLVQEAVKPGNGQAEEWQRVDLVRADRVTPEQLSEWLGNGTKAKAGSCAVHDVRWLSGPLADAKAREGA